MKNELYEDTLERLERHQIAGIPKHEKEIHPFYKGYSIANLPASILRWLEVPPPLDNPLADEILKNFHERYKHIFLLIVDGLRLEIFERFQREVLKNNYYQEWKAILERGCLLPLTSIAPSTTSAALTTFWTGRLPAEHGIIGYELFLKEFGVTANMIFHSVASFVDEPGSLYRAGFNPDAFLPVPTLGPLFNRHGVKAFTFQHNSIASSGLSQMLLKGAVNLSFQTLEDLWRSVLTLTQNNANINTYSYIYWGNLDTLSHREGPQSPQIYEEWLGFAKPLAQFLITLSALGIKDSLFILTADHGQISAEINPSYELRHHPEFTSHLVLMPTGESRLPYLFIKNGHECEVEDYLHHHWDGHFSLMPSPEVLSAGLLGHAVPHFSTLDRTGTHIVFPKQNAYWWWVNKENHLLGRHGGLSKDEMLVPFFSFEI